MDSLRRNRLLPGDCLRVRVDLTIFAPPEPSSTSLDSQVACANFLLDEEPTRAALDYKLNLEFLLGNKSFSDSKIQCGGSKGKVFLAQKSVLAARTRKSSRPCWGRT